MHITGINITNFKNIAQARLETSPKLNCFLGDNGMGKSNLLDAVYYLSFCKSFTGIADSMLIRRDEDFAMFSADYLRNGAEENVSVGMQRGRRKSFRRGGKEYRRLSEHIGRFPLVLTSPSDMGLIDGSGDERRRFADQVISQTDARYLDSLIRYNKALEQRNSMLKQPVADPALFAAVEMQMDMAAAYICKERARWVDELSAIFMRYYSAIAGDAEVPALSYKSHLAAGGSLSQLLEQTRERDRILKYTTVGPHRDDIDMQLSGMPVRRVASQGQAKTYVLALRLAQYVFLRQAVDVTPILLLDDIFDKLDAGRVERIVGMVGGSDFGQIFITDTNRKHLDEILAHAPGEYAMWNVHNGNFTRI